MPRLLFHEQPNPEKNITHSTKYRRRPLSSLMIAAFLVLCCSAVSAQTTIPVSYREHLKDSLAGWVRSFPDLSVDSLSKIDSLPFDNFGVHMVNEIDGDYLGLYRPLLRYSPNGMSFIDIWSYNWPLERRGDSVISIGHEPDQAIGLVKHGKSWVWYRIAFFGPSTHVEEAAWIENDRFMLAGVENTADDDQWRPFVWIGYLRAKNFDIYTVVNKEVVRKGDYVPRGIKEMQVHEE